MDQDQSKDQSTLPPSELGEGGEGSDFELRLALTAALVERFAVGKLTDSERRTWDHAIGQLVAVDATPDEIRERCAAWPTVFKTATLTPHGLVNQWNTLGAHSAKTAAGDERAAEKSLARWIEKTGWRLDDETARTVLEDAGFAESAIVYALERSAELRAERNGGEAATRAAIDEAAA